jgi:hypothetical protein
MTLRNDLRHGRIRDRHAEGHAPGDPHDHYDQDKRASGLVEVIEIVPERSLWNEPFHHRAYGEERDDRSRDKQCISFADAE